MTKLERKIHAAVLEGMQERGAAPVCIENADAVTKTVMRAINLFFNETETPPIAPIVPFTPEGK